MRAVLRSAAVILTAAVVCFAPAAPAAQSPPGTPAGALLKSLDNVDDLRASFNKDRGRLRLVLLLSPT